MSLRSNAIAITASFLVLGCVVAPSPPAQAGVAVGVAVYPSGPPPALRMERIPPRPYAGWYWRRGYWAWRNDNWAWVDGVWISPPRARAVWIDGHWAHRRRYWVWIEGHWR